MTSAVAEAERLQPEIIVVDGRLPGGGLEALEALGRAAPGARLALIAALSELDLVREARRRGAADALRRPLLVSQVAETLAELARSQAPERRDS